MNWFDTNESQPGYKHVQLTLRPGAELTWVKAKLGTMYGKVLSS